MSKENLASTNTSYFLSFLCLVLPCIILLNQPDVGQTVLLVLSWVAVVFISGIKLIYIFILFGISLSLIASLLFIFPDKFAYVLKRIEVFFDPSKGDRVQSNKALDAIKEGGLTGQGMGEGTLKYRVPEAHTDYIISVISEEFGSIISIFLICIFLYIAFKVIKFALQENDKFTKISLQFKREKELLVYRGSNFSWPRQSNLLYNLTAPGFNDLGVGEASRTHNKLVGSTIYHWTTQSVQKS